MRRLLLGSLLMTMVASAGCAPSADEGSGGGQSTDPGAVGKGAGGGGGGAGGGAGGGTGAPSDEIEITVFARDLILNRTANDKSPTTTEDKGLIDVNPITFDPAFFR